jgi:hypothetical protein
LSDRVEAMFGDRSIAVEADFIAFRAPDGVERQFSLQSIQCVVRSEHVFAFQVNSKVYGALYRADNEHQRRVIETLVSRLRQTAPAAGGDQFLDAQF